MRNVQVALGWRNHNVQSSSRRPRRAALVGAMSVAVSSMLVSHSSPAVANVELDVPTSTTDLTTVGATSTSDLTFTNSTYSSTAFTANSSITTGTLDDLDASQPLSISNTTTTADTLTLSGGSNSVASANGGSASDLLYVGASGNLSIVGGVTTPSVTNYLGVTLGASGNLDVAGTASITAALSGTSVNISKTGSGTLTLAPLLAAANSSLTGTFTIANGTVNLGGATNAGNNDLGASGDAVTLGSGVNNSTINFTTTSSGVAQNFTIAGTGTDTIENSAGSSTQGSAAIFAAANTISLQNNLTLANTVASSVTNTNGGNILGFRGIISQSGGTFGITVSTANVGVIDFRGANTFSGGVSINGGSVTFNAGSSGSVGALTAGPFGTGTVTLGGDPMTAATLVSPGSSTIGNAVNVGSTSNSSARTILESSATTSAGTLSGPITINAPLTLSAVTSTAAAEDRLRIGAGGISGAGNIIVNNANAGITSSTLSPIAIVGGGTATTWTGNLIVNTGVASVRTSTAIGANNIVSVASGAGFDFASNSGGVGAFSPTIAGLNNVSGAGGTVFNSESATSEALVLGGSGTYSFAGTIQDGTAAGVTSALTVNLASGGSQTLSGASTYSGGTNISSGALNLINTSGSATGTGPVNLGSATGASTGTLSGTGISTGLLTAVANAGSVASLIAPGVNTSGSGNDFGSAGTLSLGTTGGMTLTTANLDFDLAPSASGTSDLIDTGGTLTLGTDNFTFNPLTGSLDTSSPYTLIGGATGTAPSLVGVSGSVIGGGYTPTFSLNGDNLQVSFSAVPEPTSIALLLALAPAGLLVRRRRAR